ncbi:MAG: hypothetical protein R2864_10280 [Syntrophotaleaceae bacterium]
MLFLKKVDRVVGSVLGRVFPRPKQPASPVLSMGSLLLIRPGGIRRCGSAGFPAIRAFKKYYPNVEVTVLAERRNGAALCPDVNQVLLYDRPKQFLATMRQRYDVVIDTEQWHRLSAIVARLIRST